MPSPDTLATIAILAVMALGMVLITVVPPGAYERFARARRYHRTGARHALAAAAPASLSALETTPDPVSPFAARGAA
jgi:hypothetical protein